ncbi:MAG: alanine racemase [Patescibacteria group bacterium]
MSRPRPTKLFSPKNLQQYQRNVQKVLNSQEAASRGNVRPLVKQFIDQRGKILKLANKYPTPFYIFDHQGLALGIKEFKSAFAHHLPDCQYFYAVKSNYHPLLLKILVKNNFNLDVSSGRELQLALNSGAKKMVFSGPGKTEAELKLAIKNNQKVIINIDNFDELERLGKLTKKYHKNITAGIRIYTKYHGPWTKFGIPLNRLAKFWRTAHKYPQINLTGIHFHISWNESAAPYQNVIKELARYLKNNFTPTERAQIKFIDFGGGYTPDRQYGYYPWETVAGQIVKAANGSLGQLTKFTDKYYLTTAISLQKYAEGISLAIGQHLRPIIKAQYFTEPGRIICHPAMHILMRVMAVKTKNKIITDAGINLIGWERFEYEYFPIINLTRPALQEKACQIYGCLCAPDDIWGCYYYGRKIKVGDYLLVPFQGAYTYTMAQNFIQPIAPVYSLK